MSDEEHAKKLICGKHPAAVFRWKPVADSNLDAHQHICAWASEDAFQANADPVADILDGV